MEQKQYEDMATIMQFGRLFVDAMKRALHTTGLEDKGYELSLDVKRVDLNDIGVSDIIGSVELRQRGVYSGNDIMIQYCFEKEGWLVNHDPVIRSGNVPPDVRTYDAAKGFEKERKTEGKAYPPDGLWISAYPDTPVVDSWESLK